MHVNENIRCYFSFRSPYAWLAFYRLQGLVAAGGPDIEFVPLIPPRGFLDDMDPRKRLYIAQDVGRIAKAYGLELRWPDPFDTEWLRPHAAFLHALDAGKGMPFGAAVFRARFSEGRDVGDAQVLRDAAVAAGLEPEAIIAAGDSRAQRSRIIAGMRSIKEQGVFGVPYFVYRGHAYWGNDRLEWLLRDVGEQFGRPVPDLRIDPLARPF
jgi:2-hydroxychromene-2-carboxylate isomerase